MNVLVIGDPHYMTSNFQQIDDFENKLFNYLEKCQQKDYIIILGDILHDHERIHTLPLNRAYAFISKLRQYAIYEVIVLVGNHDLINNQQYLTNNHWMNGMKKWNKVRIIDKVTEIQNDCFKAIFVPYVPNGMFMKALTQSEITWEDADIIYAHQEFYGCKLDSGIDSENGDKWPEDYPNIVSGHIHLNQRLADNIYYPGSAMQHTFRENEQFKYIIYNLKYIQNEDDEIEIEEEEISLGLILKEIMYTVSEDILKFSDKLIENIKAGKVNNHIKVFVTGTYEEFKTFKKNYRYKELTNQNIKFQFKENKENKSLNKEDVQVQSSSFNAILNNLVEKENNNVLKEYYTEIFC